MSRTTPPGGVPSLREKLNGKSTRSLQPVEVYQKLYYGSRVQAAVKKEILAGNIGRSGTLKVVSDVTASQWKNETQEIKANVMARLAEFAPPVSEAEPTTGERTPSQYAE